MKYISKRLVSVGCYIVLLSTCDFSSFSKDDSTGNTFTRGEIRLVLNFAKLALNAFKGLDTNEVDEIMSQTKYAVSVHRTNYASKYGEDDVTSSMIYLVPEAPAPESGWPILLFIHHLVTSTQETPSALAKGATSFNLDDLRNFQLNYHSLLVIASAGFVVIAPDFLGYASSEGKGHPYMDASVLVPDIIYAMDHAQETLNTQGVKVDAKSVYIHGYSYGGWLAAHVYRAINTEDSLYTKYCSSSSCPSYKEYKVKSAVLGTGVYDLQKIIEHAVPHQKYPSSINSIAMIMGFVYSGKLKIEDYSDYFNSEPYPYNNLDFEGLLNSNRDRTYLDKRFSRYDTEEKSYLFVPAFIDFVKAPDKSSKNTYRDYETYRDYWELLKENSLSPWKLSGTWHVYHHKYDTTIPLLNAEEFVTSLKDFPEQKEKDIVFTRAQWGNSDDKKSSAHEQTGVPTFIYGFNVLIKEKNKSRSGSIKPPPYRVERRPACSRQGAYASRHSGAYASRHSELMPPDTRSLCLQTLGAYASRHSGAYASRHSEPMPPDTRSLCLQTLGAYASRHSGAYASRHSELMPPDTRELMPPDTRELMPPDTRSLCLQTLGAYASRHSGAMPPDTRELCLQTLGSYASRHSGAMPPDTQSLCLQTLGAYASRHSELMPLFSTYTTLKCSSYAEYCSKGI